ncbi:ADP-ribose pyrophosphatase [Bacterioplanes sanyensis]|uniref:NUDIX hydrolase n=1 Tax=Bacterioplanes sanyensis TaxID=1249553 RepID=UPI001677B91A|nr:NUDIX hydrolase [Bacterioplanes sanyensis]GGY34993.1 ADP-ribose pyrophosphatase [Bacterioplanes sanyensis]
MKYCSHCAATVSTRIPQGDNRERFVCDQCDTIFYHNPRIVAGTIPVWEDKVLLCRRAIEPRRGFWTLPAGFMENGESTEQAAQRETMEEACAEVKLGQLFSMITVPHIDQVHIFFTAELVDGRFAAGAESLEVALFAEQDIPWHELAFPTVKQTLQRFFKPDPAGVHVFDILPQQALRL